MAKQKVKYLEYDIEKSTKGRKMYKKLGGKGIPLILVGNTLIRGFDPQKILIALNQVK